MLGSFFRRRSEPFKRKYGAQPKTVETQSVLSGEGRAKDKLKPIIIWIVAMHTRLPSWVINVISSRSAQLPLLPQNPTYRCVAPLGELSSPRSWHNGGELTFGQSCRSCWAGSATSRGRPRAAPAVVASPCYNLSMPSPRRFPPPWTFDEANAACFIVRDHNGHALAYVYFESEPGRRAAANLLTKDEARRIAEGYHCRARRSSSGSLAMLAELFLTELQRRRCSNRVRAGGRIMRALAILVTVATIYSGMHDAVLAQTPTPNVTAPFQGLQTPLTSTTTNCMMLCNSQAANCKTTCFIPTPPTSITAGTLNPTANGACVSACSSNQLACQSNCALASPSR